MPLPGIDVEATSSLHILPQCHYYTTRGSLAPLVNLSSHHVASSHKPRYSLLTKIPGKKIYVIEGKEAHHNQ